MGCTESTHQHLMHTQLWEVKENVSTDAHWKTVLMLCEHVMYEGAKCVGVKRH